MCAWRRRRDGEARGHEDVRQARCGYQLSAADGAENRLRAKAETRARCQLREDRRARAGVSPGASLPWRKSQRHRPPSVGCLLSNLARASRPTAAGLTSPAWRSNPIRSTTQRPFSRQTITLRAYFQQRWVVAREMPKRQQIGFHGVRSARAQTSLASFGSSHCSQGGVASVRVLASGGNRPRRSRGASWPTRSENSAPSGPWRQSVPHARIAHLEAAEARREPGTLLPDCDRRPPAPHRR